MRGYIRFADNLSAWFGKVFAWCIVVMSVGIGYEVVVRYAFKAPTPWAFDLSYMLYGTLFMMAGAYTLSRDGHVRGDFIYRLWQPRTQAAVEFVLYFFFFFPGVTALVLAGWKYSSRAWGYFEVSSNSPAGIPIFQFKSIIVAAGIILLIQGLAQVCRCILCIRTGEWLRARDDIEETETALAQSRAGPSLQHGSEAVDIVTPARHPRNGERRG
jgi:TRAP-type mannitol/chloroaromatic compound transport system permease small subunit